VRAIFEELRKRQATLGKRLVQRERKRIAPIKPQYPNSIQRLLTAAREARRQIPEIQAGLEMMIDVTQ
jgi:hypothetical protein